MIKLNQSLLFVSRCALALAPPLLLSVLVACSGSVSTTDVTFAISDAPVGDLEAVVITIDQITINRPGDDIVIDSFPNEDPDLPDVDTFTIDLLSVRGLDSAVVVELIELEVGRYQNLRLSIVEDDIDKTYVEEDGGDIRPLKVPSGELKLGGFQVRDEGVQSFVIEFNLPKAMTYNPGPDRYILKPRGVRIVDVGRAASLAGDVDPDLFDGAAPCDEKDEATEGNAMYLYRGHGLDIDALGDNFDPDVDPDAAADLVEPYASEAVAAGGGYLFGYLPAGDYTLAFACDAEDDDPDIDDGIMVPAPADQWTEISVSEAEDARCDFPLDGGDCG